MLVVLGELSQAGKGFTDAGESVALIFYNETVFIIKSKRRLMKEISILEHKVNRSKLNEISDNEFCTIING